MEYSRTIFKTIGYYKRLTFLEKYEETITKMKNRAEFAIEKLLWFYTFSRESAEL